MSNLLVVALNTRVPDNYLRPLRQAGWLVSVTSDAAHARQLLQRGGIEVVIVLCCSSEQDKDEPVSVLRWVREFCPSAMVVMMSSETSAHEFNLIKTLNFMDDASCEAVVNQGLRPLSRRQNEIARLVAQALPNREIARRLEIKDQSLRNELTRIFKKLGVHNRVELALRMQQNLPETATGESFLQEATATWPVGLKLPLADAAARTRRVS